MKIYTIGFTGHTAKEFFETLRAKKIRRLIDIRRNNTNQLAGFSKKKDLEYFLKEILGADYHHVVLLAPAAELVEKYRGDHDWEFFNPAFRRQLKEQRARALLDRSLFDRDVVLLCSEKSANNCHRKIAAEFLAGFLKTEGIEHL
jgi:uncharacterized protein (DUF488 family)